MCFMHLPRVTELVETSGTIVLRFQSTLSEEGEVRPSVRSLALLKDRKPPSFSTLISEDALGPLMSLYFSSFPPPSHLASSTSGCDHFEPMRFGETQLCFGLYGKRLCTYNRSESVSHHIELKCGIIMGCLSIALPLGSCWYAFP